MALIINNKNQSNNRLNLLAISGIKEVGERISPKNGQRLYGGYGAFYFNENLQTGGGEDEDSPITPPDCPNCGGIDPPPPSNSDTPDTPQGCTCRSLDELGDFLEKQFTENFCEQTPIENEDEYFPCLIDKDGVELRISCPSENCDDDDDDDGEPDYVYAWAGTNTEDYIWIECEKRSQKEIRGIVSYIRNLINEHCSMDNVSPQDYYDGISINSVGEIKGSIFLSQFSTCGTDEDCCYDCCEPDDFGVLLIVGYKAEYQCF